MKKLVFAFIIFFWGLTQAQEKPQFLEVDYQTEMKFDVEQIMNNVPAQYRAMVETQIKQEIEKGIFIDYKLHTNGTESVYKMVEKISNDQSPAGMIMSQITASDKEPLYKNISERYYLKPYNFGMAYLMKDSLQNINWKISRDKENIAGFDSYKATGVMSDSINVTAWYTPKINIKDGPDRFWGLPGLILKAEFNSFGADFIITATKIAVRDEEIKIDKPSKGKVVTEEEFNKEMEEFRERMKEMYSEGVSTD